MIQDPVTGVFYTYGAPFDKGGAVGAFEFFKADTESQMPDDQVLGAPEITFSSAYTDAVARSRLSGNGGTGCSFGPELGDQVNHSGSFENNGQGLIGILSERPAKTTRNATLSVVQQIGDGHHLASSAPGGIHAIAFGRGKSRRPGCKQGSTQKPTNQDNKTDRNKNFFHNTNYKNGPFALPLLSGTGAEFQINQKRTGIDNDINNPQRK